MSTNRNLEPNGPVGRNATKAKEPLQEGEVFGDLTIWVLDKKRNGRNSPK